MLQTPPPIKIIPIQQENLVVSIPSVPFFSQFNDITTTKWKKVGCGVASLAMIIDYYKDEKISVNKILRQGIESGAYLEKEGWIHKGLISISQKYGLDGKSFDLTNSPEKLAYSKLKEQLEDGPVMVSVHYKFDPKNPIPHLVVIDAIDKNTVYYNDPASNSGNKKMTLDKFRASWKKKFIVIRPSKNSDRIAVAKL
jgi:ABC-type bacteriocin/lantibiotic exporter with double-glycine peptidase domain